MRRFLLLLNNPMRFARKHGLDRDPRLLAGLVLFALGRRLEIRIRRLRRRVRIPRRRYHAVFRDFLQRVRMARRGIKRSGRVEQDPRITESPQVDLTMELMAMAIARGAADGVPLLTERTPAFWKQEPPERLNWMEALLVRMYTDWLTSPLFEQAYQQLPQVAMSWLKATNARPAVEWLMGADRLGAERAVIDARARLWPPQEYLVRRLRDGTVLRHALPKEPAILPPREAIDAARLLMCRLCSRVFMGARSKRAQEDCPACRRRWSPKQRWALARAIAQHSNKRRRETTRRVR